MVPGAAAERDGGRAHEPAFSLRFEKRAPRPYNACRQFSPGAIGFDGGSETAWCMPRLSNFLVNPVDKHLDANDDVYALAA